MESSSKDDVDLNSIPATKTLSNEHLLEKKRLAEAQQKKYKPTRASWGKSLDDDAYDVRHYFFDSSACVTFLSARVELHYFNARVIVRRYMH